MIIGVPSAAIFCSSLKGHGIPFTEDFNDYMKEQIQAPKLVVLIMTPAYLESAFCLMELGASWANSLQALPVVVPPVGFDTVSKTLGLKQAWDINDAAGLIDLRKLVRELITVEPRDEHTWEQKRAAWRIGLKKALKDLAKPTKVARPSASLCFYSPPPPCPRPGLPLRQPRRLYEHFASIVLHHNVIGVMT
jgi:hypothetical protein